MSDEQRRGERGTSGDEGPQGEPGRSSMLTRHSSASFAAIVLLAFLVTTVAFYEANQARNAAHTARVVAAEARGLAKENRKAILTVREQSIQIGDLRAAQRQGCTNFTRLKNAVNDFHGVIKGLLRDNLARAKVTAKTSNNPASKKAAKDSLPLLRRLLSKTRTVKAQCAQNLARP